VTAPADLQPPAAASPVPGGSTLPRELLHDLAARYGTPLYVYDLDEVEAARAQLRSYLPEETELYYALKANPHPDLGRALRAAPGRGCRAEISSTGELAAALAAGFAAADCLYTGPGKTAGELREAIAAGVRTFSTDSVTDVEHVAAAARDLGTTVDCLLRINSPTSAGNTSIRMTGRPSQFGFDGEVLTDALPALRGISGIELAGLHLFPLSGATHEDDLIAEFCHTIAFAAQLHREHGLPLRLLDIGGGFNAPYGVPGERGSYPRLRAALEDALDAHLPGWRSGAPRIAFESGRYLAARAGTLVAAVSNVKVSRGRSFVVLDAGINTFGGMSGLGRLLPVEVSLGDCGGTDAGQVQGVGQGAGAERGEEAPAVARASLVGPLCTPGDLLGRDVRVPVLAPGDLVVIPNTGAYGPTASVLCFLGRPAPIEVAVRGGEIVSASRIEYSRGFLTGGRHP